MNHLYLMAAGMALLAIGQGMKSYEIYQGYQEAAPEDVAKYSKAIPSNTVPNTPIVDGCAPLVPMIENHLSDGKINVKEYREFAQSWTDEYERQNGENAKIQAKMGKPLIKNCLTPPEK